MSTVMHDVAGAALPVAIGLLVLTAFARVLLTDRGGEPGARRIALQHLDPLSTWCIGASLLDAVAVGLSNALGVTSVAVPVVIAVAAMALRAPVEDGAPAPVAAEPAAAVPHRRTLWVDPADEAEARQGLWRGG